MQVNYSVSNWVYTRMYIDLVDNGVVTYIYNMKILMNGQLLARQDTEENSHVLLQKIWRLLRKYTNETHGKPTANLTLFSE
jgi:hypothetical protein